MAITVTDCTDDDFNMELANLMFDTVGRSVIVAALNPTADTPAGRRLAIDMCKAANQSPNVRWVVARDGDGGEVTGVASFAVFDDLDDGKLKPVTLKDPGGNWPNEEERLWAETMINCAWTHRNMMLTGARDRVVSVNRMVVSEKQQRCGVGTELLKYGLNWADSLKSELILEATQAGKGLYLKHGFVEHHFAVLELPPPYQDRPKVSRSFMIRPVS